MGPFSPARGIRSGFRCRNGRVGTWVGYDELEFWTMAAGRGANVLAEFVSRHWSGGRVLLLPNGYVVKPLQKDVEVGFRVLVGRFEGPIRLERWGEAPFDLSDVSRFRPGDLWTGPASTGLECTIRGDGSLACTWYHPAPWGRDDSTHLLRGADSSLASGFRAARPGETTGRVRITANGCVITKRQHADGTWTTHFVGSVERKAWGNWSRWIDKEGV
jgi:hypothetical protein